MKKQQPIEPSRPPRSCKAVVRFSESEMIIIQQGARRFTNGNLSEWIRHCVLTAQPGKRKGV